MTKGPAAHFGILPSLEVLPFFADDPGADAPVPFSLRAHSSYGEIIRNMLTRELAGGIIPWEIFVADVLALPGQRAAWKVPLFLHACPTELVLREPVFRAFYPAHPAKPKLPPRLTVGVEGQNSLTKSQSRAWLGHWKNGSAVGLTFKMLPMDLMIQALKAEIIDAIIAPSPWGIHAESAGLGRRDPRFSPGTFAQRLVMVCHREFLDSVPDFSTRISAGISAARTRLRDDRGFDQAISRMLKCGKPNVRAGLLERAAAIHAFDTLDRDVVPDLAKLVAELMSLEEACVLPAQVSAGEQTARLLLPAGIS